MSKIQPTPIESATACLTEAVALVKCTDRYLEYEQVEPFVRLLDQFVNGCPATGTVSNLVKLRKNLAISYARCETLHCYAEAEVWNATTDEPATNCVEHE